MRLRLSFFCLLLLLAFIPASAQTDTTADRINAVENSLNPVVRLAGEPETARMADRMAFHRVPGVSVAVIDNGQIAWTQTWGVRDAASGAPVTTDTVFQVASISKAVSASGIMTLVDSGAIALDTDVNEYLRSWKVPATPQTEAAPVTMARLLSHTAGTTVHGFAGYDTSAALPTLIEILNGEAPANSPEVIVATVPGRQFQYSGGGYEIAQLVAEEVTGEPFTAYMQAHVLDTIGMTHSQYRTPKGDDIALAHLLDGTPLASGWHVYPEDAAASLWTTASDLALWALEIRSAYHGESAMLSQEAARAMLTRHGSSQGLGPALQEVIGDLAFYHGGANLGYRAYVVLLRESGDGVAILTNGEGGAALWEEILSAVATVYDWPGWFEVRNQRVIAEIDLEPYAGTYHGLVDITLSVDGDRLLLHIPEALGGGLAAFFPASETSFFDVYSGLSNLIFDVADDGSVTGLSTYVSGMGALEFTRSAP